MRSRITFNIILTLLVVFSAFAKAYSQQPSSKKFKVVIDAGHGGDDPGKPSKAGFKESDIALKIALALGEQLEKNTDIDVVYTRKTDVFIKLRERGAIANREKADLFISIHCNAHNTQAYGTETYVLGLHANEENLRVAKAENSVIFMEEDYEVAYADYNINSPESIIGLNLMQEEFLDQSILIASMVQDNFTKDLGRKNRSVKQAGFVVLHQTTMPSILIETGFITNVTEGKYLASKKGQQEIAGAIAKSVRSYKDKVFVFEPTAFKEQSVAVEKKQIFNNVTFKVQLAASSKKLEPKSYNFKKLPEISRVRDGNLYKYYSGSTNDYNAIRKRLAEAKSKGYTSAFIVSFDDNNIKIPLDKVLN
ncbi:N-acetylmuramoyl-L-alanine amidase [Dokdonia sinensis]|uniref:N-acetylmuramoyl-L-alanine amidase n=1 Tax=Dokdonia sinensis TaxID=2479847 RepID=A0A3M0GH54_9FLAO|nr:N-acetylmuramoyl-L-alanine amidase [Dokdonia sinensis]RMB60913.1 N-acetylmuramoyl-L-alanine amidase [Dokdonia sinensis]